MTLNSSGTVSFASLFNQLCHLSDRRLLAGDIAYADYWLKEEIQDFLPNTSIADGFHVYESLLNQFFDEMTPITSQKPYMVGPGNHDSNCEYQTNFIFFPEHIFNIHKKATTEDLLHSMSAYAL